MAEDYKWEEVGGGNEKIWNSKSNPLKKGDSIQGRLIKVKPNQGKKKNSTIYILETGEDEMAVWGSTVLDRKMGDVAIGKMVKITYEGMQMGKNGGSEYKDWKVLVGIDSPGDESE